MSKHQRVIRGMLALVLGGTALLVQTQQAHAEQTTVRVEIYSVLQIENPDGDGTDGDYFPEVSIGGGPAESRGRVEDDDFAVDWVFNRTVDVPANREVPISIRLIDFDTFAAGEDDIMDISPQNNDVELNLNFNPDLDRWFGDVHAYLGVAQGDGDHGYPEPNDGRKARILFSVTTQSSNDLDGDGIPNMVERFGVRRPDGSVVHEHDMDPCKKTILLQMDSMYRPPSGSMPALNHAVTAAARKEVVDAFEDAPVGAVNPCPFGGPPRDDGVDFVFLPAKSVDHRDEMVFDDAYRANRARNFDPAFRPYAHYGIMAHEQKKGNSSSGLCCEREQGSKDILVTLGPAWANSVGSDRDQSGSIMHELGHSLGLGHGGHDPTNFKPNYLSVMNYAFDPGGIPTDGSGGARLDYSRQDLRDLPKNSLDEYLGVGRLTGSKDFTIWKDANGQSQRGKVDGALNWNGNKDANGLPIIDDQNVPVDINADDDVCILPGANGKLDTDPEDGDSKVGGSHPAILEGDKPGCQTTEDDEDDTGRAPVLTGHDDWAHLRFRAVGAEGGAGVAVEHGPDVTFEEVSQRQADWQAFFDPDLVTTKTADLAETEPGRTVAYRVDVKNAGTGTATAVRLTDTFPDGTTTTKSMDDVAAGYTRTENFSYDVPCSTVDGTVLTNRATVTATDLGDSPESDTTDNTGSATTKVRAPKLELSRAATAAVLAGGPITTTLTVRNAGSGTATGVTVTDTLPADVYYSGALDTGAGPRPTAVVRNADGTTTLTWAVGSVAGTAGVTIEYTARPSLLFLGGSTLTGTATVAYSNAAGCVYDTVTASAVTTVTEVRPTANPLSAGYWTTHEEARTAELRARIQATDQRYDVDGDGSLSNAEADLALDTGGPQPGQLRRQELAVLFDLADRRINAGTAIGGELATRLGTGNVREAVLYGMATLALPVGSATASQYSDATTLLDLIANNRIERY